MSTRFFSDENRADGTIHTAVELTAQTLDEAKRYADEQIRLGKCTLVAVYDGADNYGDDIASYIARPRAR